MYQYNQLEEEAPVLERTEETLDPRDWEGLAALGHRMVDDMLGYLRSVRERPAWQPVPTEVREELRQGLPRQPRNLEAVYEDFQRLVLPYPVGNIHPRFWGWVIGTGSPSGMLAEMLAAGLNSNVFGGDQAPQLVELQVIDWFKEVFGLPAGSSGLLVSGASMANYVAMTVARNSRAGFDVAEEGVQGGPYRLTFYGSAETHSSLKRAAELLGLGNRAFRRIPVNPDFTVDVDALRQAIQEDRAAGFHPFCVVGNAGTVNTGATDDLNALADLCAAEGLWLHVDGAFGATAALSPALRPRLAGLERADSIAFDLHKWMHMPIEVGCVLVRDRAEHHRAFAGQASYLAHLERGVTAEETWLTEYGPQLSRGFRALKVWMAIQEHGIDLYGRLVEQNVEQARYLARRIEETPELELLAPVPLNIVCFRFRAPGLDAEALDRFNADLLGRLHESGVAVPTFTRIHGAFAIRVAITNHRSRREDFDLLVSEVVRLGREALAG